MVESIYHRSASPVNTSSDYFSNNPLDLNGKLALLDCTDTGNAERLAARFGDDLRYCHTWKCWLVWNGQYWKRDETGQATERAKETARMILAEAGSTKDDAKRNALAAWSKSTQGRDRLLAMIALAQSLPKISAIADDFDTNGWLFNVKNGTIDLQTGRLREPERDDMITRLSPIPYHTDAPCPLWTNFLATVLPDAEVRDFTQRAVGYSLTGSVRDHVLFFLYGQGKNGKSTFIDTLEKICSDYFCRLRADVLMQDRNGPNKGATPELATLRGSRFVAVSELNEGQKMDEGLIKSLTGGDSITARPLYQKAETFAPTHKLWLAGNHRPVIKGSDEGIWRRPKLIPFTVTIAPQQCDPRLSEKLEAELPGILAWAVQGCLQWQESGLTPPPSVEAATQEYRAEMDALAPFLEESCVLQPRLQATKAALWIAYQAWADASGEQTYPTQRSLNTAIKRLNGISEGASGSNGAKTWFGIGLKTDTQDTGNPEPLTELTNQTENLETFPNQSLAYTNFSEIQSVQSVQSAKGSSQLQVAA